MDDKNTLKFKIRGFRELEATARGPLAIWAIVFVVFMWVAAEIVIRSQWLMSVK